jgi:UDP-galactopyranose mutase
MNNVLIIGAGLSGATIANLFATKLNKKVLVLEKRNHIAGNCYDFIDNETGLLVSAYGPHFFHTNDEEVWKYISQFSEWIRYDVKILSNVDNQLVPVPVNMETINVLCNQTLKSESEVQKWLNKNQIQNDTPKNGEEIALSRVGAILYEKMFKPYTIKQWNKDPKELDQSVLARIPVRTSMDSRYFTDKYQGLPKYGYAALVENMLNHPNITVQLNTEYTREMNIPHEILIYTGPIDGYFASKGLPKLEYRSLRFEVERKMNYGYYQQGVQVNYPSLDYSYTRIVEYKHLPYPKTEHTYIVREYPSDTGEPYYPVPTRENQELYETYKNLAENESNVHMIGRLANYKYFNMDQAVRNSIDYFNNKFYNGC